MNLKKHGINKRIEIDMKSNIKFPGLFLVLCILITGCMDSSFNKKININNNLMEEYLSNFDIVTQNKIKKIIYKLKLFDMERSEA